MRNIVAKFFRREALGEMLRDNVPKRDLVQRQSGEVINSPSSIRHLYLQLKAKYKRMRAGMSTISWWDARAKDLVKHHVSRGHGPKAASKPQPDDRIMRIQKPLMLILQHCPPAEKPDGSYEPHPVYRSARSAADSGRGDLVQRMARQFLPA